jgi:murein DD-endopeptidase MepM/ murein hydrolase activator NlpD
MTHITSCLAITTLLLVSGIASALPRENTPVPGGIAIIPLPDNANPSSARYNGRKVLVTQQDGKTVAVVGLALGTKPGSYQLQAKSAAGKSLGIAFTVADKAYEEQHITIEDKRKVNPEPRDQQRIARAKQIMPRWNAGRPDNVVVEFHKPVTGPTSSPFDCGFSTSRRATAQRSDIAAAAPVRAPAPGTVIETGDFFFNCNTADRPRPGVTMYCHLSAIDVKRGDRLRTGDRIGKVSMTVRHRPTPALGVSLNDARVDPLLFLPPDNPKIRRTEEPYR